MIGLIKKYFSPLSDNPDIHRKELVLNSILGFCFVLIIIFEVLVIIYDAIGIGRMHWLFFLCIVSPFIASYYFSRRVKMTIASTIFIATFTLGVTYGITQWGATLPAILLSMALLTTLTGILINSRAGFIYALCLAGLLVLYIYGVRLHIISPDFSWTQGDLELGDIIELSVFLLFISGISWISNRQTELSLARARQSEHELRIERDQLEITVANRTKALEQAQIERISELYTYIEFGKMSGGLIHDIMSPLNAICIELERDYGNFSNTLKKSAAHLVGSSRKIQDIIRAARRQIQINLHKESFSPRTIIEECIHLQNHRITRLHIDIRTSLKIPDTISGYPSLFAHIITNLLSNAIDACEDATKVFARNKYRAQISIEAMAQQHILHLVIKDNGAGIPEDIAKNIFNPFFTTKNTQGCGYGLPASLHMVQKYFNGNLQLIRYGSSKQYSTKTNRYRTAFELTIPIK